LLVKDDTSTTRGPSWLDYPNVLFSIETKLGVLLFKLFKEFEGFFKVRVSIHQSCILVILLYWLLLILIFIVNKIFIILLSSGLLIF
jgi:hypothetical protein